MVPVHSSGIKANFQDTRERYGQAKTTTNQKKRIYRIFSKVKKVNVFMVFSQNVSRVELTEEQWLKSGMNSQRIKYST